MNTRKWFVGVSLLIVLSMVLAACAGATTAPQTPQVVEKTVEVVTTQEIVTTQIVEKTVEVMVTPTPVPSTRTGAWVDQVVFTSIDDANAAVSQIQAGELDIYAYTVNDAELFKTVSEDPNLAYTTAFGSANEITYNPATCTDTAKLNPFTNAKIREATNMLYDRSYVAQEIMGGLGVPKLMPIVYGFPDYTKYIAKARELEAKYAYNPEMAKEIITTEMEGMGATLGSDGKWQYNGAPVTLIGLIRTEDERQQIGDYVATQLENVGFTVDRQFKTRSEASPIWVQSDPAECLFNFYTGGWITTEITRDDGSNFSFYYTSRDYPIPLWQAYKASPEFDEVTLKLRNNDFTSLEERDQLFARAMELALADEGSGSVRVWITDGQGFAARSADTSVTADLAGAIAGTRLWALTGRFNGLEGGVLRVAQPGLLVDPWNPIAGSNWIYDMMPIRATENQPTVADPYTGLRLPWRLDTATVVAKEGLPMGKSLDWIDLSFQPEITVPTDAWSDWDAVNQQWITAGEKFPDGATANVKVSVCYPGDLFDTIKWHDGSPLTLADFISAMIWNFDTGKEDSKNYDAALGETLAAFLDHFKAVQITSTDPLCIDTYDDYVALEAEGLFSFFDYGWWPEWSNYGPVPWHTAAITGLADADGKLAFSSDKADEKQVEWMNMTAGPSLEILKGYLDTATAENYVPFANVMNDYVSPDEITSRYANLGTWYAERNNFWVGTGPFYLWRVYPVENTLTLQRNPDFPDSSEKWSGFAEPKLPVAEVDGPGQVAAGEEATFDVFVTFKGEPYPSAEMTAVKYLVFDAAGTLVTQGDATLVTDGQYQVVLGSDVTGGMTSGSYKMEVSAVSSLVSIPGFGTFEFIVP
jgi:peptide/nickel transport system substrate-binding protein